MSTIVANVFATICSFANPYQCEWVVDFTTPVAGQSVAACEAEAEKYIAEWTDKNRPGYLIRKVHCKFVQAQGV